MWWLIDGQQCAKINILYDFESKCQKKVWKQDLIIVGLLCFIDHNRLFVVTFLT